MIENKILWRPDPVKADQSQMKKFWKFAEKKSGLHFDQFIDLYDWSCRDLENFWAYFLEFSEVIYTEKYDKVIIPDQRFSVNSTSSTAETDLHYQWFPGLKLNFAENLLRYRDDKTAVISVAEDGITEEISYSELFTRVENLAESLKESGIVPGDVIAGWMPNIPEAIIAMLAATSLGAVWTSCSPDFGIKGVLDRFGQTKPRLLFTTDGYTYKGKKISLKEKRRELLSSVSAIEKVIVVDYAHVDETFEDPREILWNNFISKKNGKLQFYQAGFNHPVYIMYSSGTTGLPKCMVQGPGVLLNHIKEHRLHTDLRREDVFFYFTTCGWMMWNWLVSALATGATLVLYEGNPMFPGPGRLLEMSQKLSITIFGTSARYLMSLKDFGIDVRKNYRLKKLRTILSTGSTLPPEGFDYVYSAFPETVQLSSIAGGTDLNGCFALGCPVEPVIRGRLQTRGLGMAVRVYSSEGRELINQQGELVCVKTFPSMPVYFHGDAGNKRYHDAYFNVYPGIWRHGDFADLHKDGTIAIYGRSDATLNPGGVRIGTAEIYRIVESFSQISDSVAVGLRKNDDESVILFVKMNTGEKLTEELESQMRKKIKSEASPRHVPAKIIATPDIPYTISMKKVEIAVRQILDGQTVLNADALMNPECLEWYKNLKL